MNPPRCAGRLARTDIERKVPRRCDFGRTLWNRGRQRTTNSTCSQDLRGSATLAPRGQVTPERGVHGWLRPVAKTALTSPIRTAPTWSVPLSRGKARDGTSSEGRAEESSKPKKGNKPKGASSSVQVATPGAATDSAVEQDLEVGDPEMARTRDAATRRVKEPETGGTARRYQAVVIRYGCSRGESSEGSCATGKGRGPGAPLGGNSARDQKRSEPHGRLRVATYLQDVDAE
jgi:hypothetical protein